MKRPFAEGFIRAMLDPARIGQAQLVFIEVRLDHMAPHVFDRFADMVMFQDFLQRVILPLPGVRETHTYASIANVKPDALLPI
ncbi:hypothetical protein [Mesorhizobium ciceri]|uniref:hypothetical protein n=1 Tax=Mesorhizobium TaxID=68287 RepID=UPI0004B16E8F|nr:hypothetical protein [Mesorhizobium ciceri]